MADSGCPRCGGSPWKLHSDECADCGLTAKEAMIAKANGLDLSRWWPGAPISWIPELERRIKEQRLAGGHDTAQARRALVSRMTNECLEQIKTLGASMGFT